jgi:hypothetical protein
VANHGAHEQENQSRAGWNRFATLGRVKSPLLMDPG